MGDVRLAEQQVVFVPPVLSVSRKPALQMPQGSTRVVLLVFWFKDYILPI